MNARIMINYYGLVNLIKVKEMIYIQYSNKEDRNTDIYIQIDLTQTQSQLHEKKHTEGNR